MHDGPNRCLSGTSERRRDRPARIDERNPIDRIESRVNVTRDRASRLPSLGQITPSRTRAEIRRSRSILFLCDAAKVRIPPNRRPTPGSTHSPHPARHRAAGVGRDAMLYITVVHDIIRTTIHGGSGHGIGRRRDKIASRRLAGMSSERGAALKRARDFAGMQAAKFSKPRLVGECCPLIDIELDQYCL